MNESTIAGPAFVEAATPVSVKIPAPIMAPIPRAISADGPRERRSECSPVTLDSAMMLSSGLTANRFIVDSVLSFANHLLHHAQEILTHYLLHVRFGVAAAEQRRHQRGHL